MFYASSPCILVNIKYPAAQLFMVLLQTMATRWQHFFIPHTSFYFFPIISLLLYIGIKWISDLLFVSGVQDLDSVIHRHLSIIFWVLFAFR